MAHHDAVHIAGVYRPSFQRETGFGLLPNAVVHLASSLSTSKISAGKFNLPETFWSTSMAP